MDYTLHKQRSKISYKETKNSHNCIVMIRTGRKGGVED